MARRKQRPNPFRGIFQAFVLGGAVVALWAMPQWTWQGDLRVIGAKRLMAAPLAESLADMKGQPLFKIDPQAVRQVVLKNPAIADAKVRRWLFPSRLEVTLQEREPLARLSPELAVDVQGVVFRMSEGTQGLKLSLKAPVKDGKLGDEALQGLRDLVLYGEGLSGEIDMTRPGDWTGKLKGIQVRLGDGRGIAQKLHVLRHLSPLAESGSAAVEYVDLRSPDAPVVKGSDSTH